MPFRSRRAVPDHLAVEVDGVRLEALLRLNPRARRITLRVDHVHRRAIVTAPAPRHVARAERLLRDHAGWLRQRLDALPDAMPFADGGTVPLRGRPHVIRVDGDLARATILDDAIMAPSDPARLCAAMEEALRAEARADLAEASARHAKTIDVTFNRIRIGDPARRWGSCSTSGTLSFSWRLVLAPPAVLDYVAAHEVAHLREMNHGPRFWAHVAALCPDWKTHSAWLKANGQRLHAVGRAS